MARQDAARVKTSALLHGLFEAPDLEGFMSRNAEAIQTPLFHTYISELCRTMGQVPARVIKQASIERTYGYQLFNGTRMPSRDKVIQLAFGLGLNVGDTQRLLKAAQMSLLYPRIKRDAAILYCLNNHRDTIETQSVLETMGLTLLGGEEKHG